MQPIIKSATSTITFAISDRNRACLFGEIQAPGIVQYHSLLAIYGHEKDPICFYAAEWNRMDPSTVEEPVFGIFADGKHSNLGASRVWRDPYLFLLKAVELARSDFEVKSTALSEGEAWALTSILKSLNAAKAQGKPVAQEAAYWEAVRHNDGRPPALLQQECYRTHWLPHVRCCR